MANQGAKKRKEENTRHMRNLLRLIILCNVIYLLVRAGIFHSTFRWKHWVGLILTGFAYVIPYKQLASMAKPAYTDDGELLDGGFDMSTGGACGYLHDIIYITSFVQLSSIISDKFWYIYLVIPAFAVYKVWDLVKGFFFQGSAEIPAFAGYKVWDLVKGFFFQGSAEGAEEDEKSRKKREKMEKRASRGKIMKTRNR